MRSPVRRLLLALGLVAAATTIALAGTAAPAHAGTCYIIQVGPQSVEICP